MKKKRRRKREERLFGETMFSVAVDEVVVLAVAPARVVVAARKRKEVCSGGERGNERPWQEGE